MGFRPIISALILLAAIRCAAQDQTTQRQAPIPGVASKIPPLGTMRRATLQEGTPYEVPIGAMPTTVLMPAPIEQFFGEGITTDGAHAAAVYLDGTTGNRFFSVKALLPGFADVNILCGGHLYSFRFFLSDNPTRTLTILPPETLAANDARPRRGITAQRLYNILQDAKTYFLVQDQYPGIDRGIQVAAPGSIQRAGTHRIIIDQIFRFNEADTIVFRVLFINDTFERLLYSASDAGIRVGQNVYWASFADLSGEIPAALPGLLSWTPTRAGVHADLDGPDGATNDITDHYKVQLRAPGIYTLHLSAPKVEGKAPVTESISFTIDPLNAQKSPALATLQARPRADALLKSAELTQPRTGQTFGYILITGNPDGTRADVSIDNTFSVILPVHAAP